ncbi:hypothetical protein TPE_2624 [Treponema pedis str. T A4]|uniref:Uncharacterized protein n=1 Tax=Treponema pedis str. T A4 TaxID=1291379 RepID=S6A563_9SPIR|nr:hypothetical protein TPE_2624 [Treponema pedis str. T A4]
MTACLKKARLDLGTYRIFFKNDIKYAEKLPVFISSLRSKYEG